YQPQDQVDEDDRYLDPSKGVNYEAGIKAGWLDGRLLATIAVFKADQQGLATPVGFNDLGSYIYAGVDVESRGIELEATGRINDWLELIAGYTTLELDGLDGEDTYAWVPRRSANLLLSGRLPGNEAFSWGVGGRWQSRIANGAVSQDGHAVINAYAAWDFLPNASVRLNAGNLGDQKYINTLRYGAGYYGAPRNCPLSLDWRCCRRSHRRHSHARYVHPLTPSTHGAGRAGWRRCAWWLCVRLGPDRRVDGAAVQGRHGF